MLFLILMSPFLVPSVHSNREVMKSFSYAFGVKLFECGEQTNYTERMASDIIHFWENSDGVHHEETGCLVICAMVRLRLLDKRGNLIEGNAEGFVRASGADDSTVKFMIDLYSMCRRETTSIASGCEAALELSKCFRSGIHRLHWIPDISSLLVIPYE